VNTCAQSALPVPGTYPRAGRAQRHIAVSESRALRPPFPESPRKTMRVNPREIVLCLQHLRLCRAIGDPRGTYAEIPFLVARLGQVFDRKVPEEAYWAAAERENLTRVSPDGTPLVSIDPVSAWALIAARNEQLGKPTFYGFHPMSAAERTRVWALRPRALRVLRGEDGDALRCPPTR
jgi:hypothetical protein